MQDNESLYSNSNNGSDNNVAKLTVQRCIKNSDSLKRNNKCPIKIRVCIFFDGTYNNRFNVDKGVNEIAHPPQEVNEKGDSYNNDHTNIDKLEKMWMGDPSYDLSFSIYIEGIGTLDNAADDERGGAFGDGKTGIIAKVDAGVGRIVNGITKKTESKNIECLYLDAFGFSRGAAAVRYFVYIASNEDGKILKDKLSENGFFVNKIKVKFIGLYDTVASYGMVHFNDTFDLHLDSIKNAERVVQLAAADEHRANFSLTNINSAQNGLQIFLPGVHSDIGGGYRDNSEEDFTVFYYEDRTKHNERHCFTKEDANTNNRELNWLIESGWYLGSEIEEVYSAFYDVYSLVVRRNNIKNSYSRIPLKLMADYAYEGGVNFEPPSEYNAVPPELENVERMINKYICGLGSKQSHQDDWFKGTNSVLKKLRNEYLHFSSRYFTALGAHDPRFTGGSPQLGQRERRIQNG
jgi:hypothetical protein